MSLVTDAERLAVGVLTRVWAPHAASGSTATTPVHRHIRSGE